MTSTQDLLTIGDFARAAGLTPKALRLYDDLEAATAELQSDSSALTRALLGSAGAGRPRPGPAAD